jgi:hypothetical protein
MRISIFQLKSMAIATQGTFVNKEPPTLLERTQPNDKSNHASIGNPWLSFAIHYLFQRRFGTDPA